MVTPASDPEKRDEVQASSTPLEDKISFSSFSSPFQSLLDDCTVSDDVFQDLMPTPQLNSQNFHEDISFLNQPDMMNLDDFSYYPDDSVRTPEDHGNPPDRSRTLCLPILSY